MAKEIQLTQGKVAIVDDEDFEYLNQFKWYAHKNKSSIHIFYAERSIRINKKKKFLSMHRVIMNTEKDMIVDHINGDGLDNRKCNLRSCNHSENMKNRKISIKNTSGFKGVHFNKRDNKWRVMIKLNCKKIHIGNYIDIKDAAKAYNEAAIKFHGEFAKLNEI